MKVIVGGREVLIDKEDESLFLSRAWFITGAGYLCCKVRDVCGNRRTKLFHRLAMSPIPDGLVVDHINRNKLDNRKENLRLVTPSENCKNLSPESHAKKRGKHPPGVSWNRGKWQVVTRQSGKITWHGAFDSQEDASRVAKKVAPWLYTQDKFMPVPPNPTT